MSCKSLIYVSNTNSQTLEAGEVVNFGAVVRKFGKNIYTSGGNVLTRGEGYYDIDASVTFSVATAGSYTVTLYKDGVEIPGAEATAYVGASPETVNIPAVIRNVCCAEEVITAKINTAAVVTAASMVVKKV